MSRLSGEYIQMNRSLRAPGTNPIYSQRLNLQPALNTFGLPAQDFRIRFDGCMHEQLFPRAAGNDVKVHMRNRLTRGRAIDLRDHDAWRVECSLYRRGNLLRGANTSGGACR